jgi:hypothetical protein
VRSLSAVHGPREAALFVRVAAFAASVPLLMRLPLPRLAALVTRPPRRRRGRHADALDAEVERIERLVALAPRVARPLVQTGCLTRGLTLYRFLRRAGLDVELRFGLDPRGGGEAAADGHCWLVLAGEPFLEPEDPRRFAELWRLPLARP